MTRRTKVVISIITLICVLLVASYLDTTSHTSQDILEDFEQQITSESNQLNPLEEKEEDTNLLLIDVANKSESVIDKVFDKIIRFIKLFTD